MVSDSEAVSSLGRVAGGVVRGMVGELTMYTTQEQLNVAGVYALFETAIAAKLKYPKVRLLAIAGEHDPTKCGCSYVGNNAWTCGHIDGEFLEDKHQAVVLNRAGDRSKYTGQIMVTDGRPFGVNKYFGRIDHSGVFHATDSATAAISELLRRLGENPAEVASEYGRLTGNCCFCSRRLDDARSTAVGYGKICASKYGLPWG